MSEKSPSRVVTTYRCGLAWLPGGLARDVHVDVDAAGRIAAVRTGAAPTPAPNPAPAPTPAVVTLPGLVLPGLANAHSHAFHRALRGRTHSGRGSFWTWREAMYAVAGRLDPDSYLALATAAYAEMALAGISVVGEFHYLHHDVDGRRYADPNAMGHALAEAARRAGIRLTLLDTCYLSGGLGPGGPVPLTGAQVRFGDGDAQRWAERVASLGSDDRVRVGAALHSVRAVPREAIPDVVAAAAGRPLHVHLSEQADENDACLAAYKMSPTRLLADAGALGLASTAVHATHVSRADIGLLGSSGTAVCLCPTTERDLADGIGPAAALAAAGSPLCLGSDQNAVIDLLEEARGMEMHERLTSHERGRFSVAELVAAASVAGHRALGWQDAGHIAVGARADLVAVRLDTARTAGADPGQVVLAATAADVDTVVVDGRVLVSGGVHRDIDVAGALSAAIEPLWEDG